MFQGLDGLIGAKRYDAGKFKLAAKLFEEMMTSSGYPDLLTLIAYDHLD